MDVELPADDDPEYYRDPLTAVTAYQEQLYLGQWDWRALVNELHEKVEASMESQLALLEAISILRILREEHDPAVADALFALIEEHIDLWCNEAGLIIIVDILDIIVRFRRPEDIPRLSDMMCWDLYQIPSQIFLLIRKYGWEALWKEITKSLDIAGEYDNFIRAQFFSTQDVINEIASLGGTMVPPEIRKELSQLRRVSSELHRPTLFTEGKTDAEILIEAWNKLYSPTPVPYNIRACDPVPGGAGGGGGGATMLAKLISSVPADTPAPVIAVFDRDKEGVDAFQRLPSYFRSSPAQDVKWVENGRAVALLLPIPTGREAFGEIQNLSIEFYFSEAALSTRLPDGRGLDLRFPEIEERVKRHGNPVIRTYVSTLPETRDIVSGKTVFSSQIVPRLSAAEFEPFRALFEAVHNSLSLI